VGFVALHKLQFVLCIGEFATRFLGEEKPEEVRMGKPHSSPAVAYNSYRRCYQYPFPFAPEYTLALSFSQNLIMLE
jgi:hypothetical protein